MSQRLSKYITSFDFFDKLLIVLSAASGNTSIASCATVTGAPVVIVNGSITLAFLMSTEILKRLLKTTRNKKT